MQVHEIRCRMKTSKKDPAKSKGGYDAKKELKAIARERVGAVHLTHGVHEIRVSYFQGPRYQVALILKVAPPGEELRIFSTDEWKPPPSP